MMEMLVNRRSLFALAAGAATVPMLPRASFAQVATITGAGATFVEQRLCRHACAGTSCFRKVALLH